MKLPVLEEYFSGYSVPEHYKNVASCIIRRFNISGSADGMYICNCLAHASGTGDGRGNFTTGDVKIEECARIILNAYACNIRTTDSEELQEIIKTGEINPVFAVPGICSAIRLVRRETPFERGGRHTKQYILRSVHNYADALDEITGSLPSGYVPDYYTPGFIRDEY